MIFRAIIGSVKHRLNGLFGRREEAKEPVKSVVEIKGNGIKTESRSLVPTPLFYFDEQKAKPIAQAQVLNPVVSPKISVLPSTSTEGYEDLKPDERYLESREEREPQPDSRNYFGEIKQPKKRIAIEKFNIYSPKVISSLYKLVLENNSVTNYLEVLLKVEKAYNRLVRAEDAYTDAQINPKVLRIKKDLMTLESLIRARIEYQRGGEIKDNSGNVVDKVDYGKYATFDDFLSNSVLRRGRDDYNKGNFSPFISEEGTFHRESLARYLKE